MTKDKKKADLHASVKLKVCERPTPYLLVESARRGGEPRDAPKPSNDRRQRRAQRVPGLGQRVGLVDGQVAEGLAECSGLLAFADSPEMTGAIYEGHPVPPKSEKTARSMICFATHPW